MPRILFPALVILSTAPTLAAADSAENCAATSAIVAEAVSLRADGATQAAATRTLGAADIDGKYLPAVQPLVEWVYTLPEDQLTAAAPTAFEAACLKQAG
ncbi:DNA primase [Pelagivirga sediminicola]|uniref:DNA primase n=1 Tax=Pelagivirga sediminicola TaxID=2170575 RepID=A0A2T7G744_9RHOB|nr:DNA primase [Pelagivirga sediminicola]PVA10251.1 DNA primase [Pelagivirga sediminicola]